MRPTDGDSDTGSTLRAGWHDRGYLPHLKAGHGTYFVTFRLADTLPREIIERYCLERDDLIERAEAMGRELSCEEKRRGTDLYSGRIESYLDAGHGRKSEALPSAGRSEAGLWISRHAVGGGFLLGYGSHPAAGLWLSPAERTIVVS